MPAVVIDALRHNERLLAMVREGVQKVLPRVAERAAETAASHAPTVDEEYAELNADSGSSPMVPRSGDSSADTDGRVRFSKLESTYLQNCIMAPENLSIDPENMQVRVGSLAWMESNTFFSYTNADVVLDKDGSVKSSTPRGTYTVGPYFQMFEAGVAAFTVTPHERTSQGRFYPLRPGEGKDGARAYMVKSIAPYNMFLFDYLDTVARATITAALAAMGPGRPK